MDGSNSIIVSCFPFFGLIKDDSLSMSRRKPVHALKMCWGLFEIQFVSIVYEG